MNIKATEFYKRLKATYSIVFNALVKRCIELDFLVSLLNIYRQLFAFSYIVQEMSLLTEILANWLQIFWTSRQTFLNFKAPNKNCSRRHLIFLLLSFEENKAWFFMWIFCLAEDSLETSSLIFSEKQWKNIYECRLLQSWLALEGLMGCIKIGNPTPVEAFSSW